MAVKLNLGCGTDVIMGYRNIDIKPQHQLVEKGDCRNLDNLSVASDSVDEIRAILLLEHISYYEISNVLQHWWSKLKKGGRIYIYDTDSALFGNMMAKFQINTQELNSVLFGNQNEAIKLGIYNLPYIENIFQQFKARTISKGINGTNFFIEIEKPI